MTILIVYLSFIYIYSIMLNFHIFFWSLYWTKYVFIYLEVTTDRSSIK